MRQSSVTDRGLIAFQARALLVACAVGCAVGADNPGHVDLAELHAHHEAAAEPNFAERASATAERVLQITIKLSRRTGRALVAWYINTPPADRVTWGGMAACAGLGLAVIVERLARLRKHKIIPADGSIVARRSIIVSDIPVRRRASPWPLSAAGAGRPPTSSERLRWRTASRASG
jgi:hypothetical protein